MARLTRIGLLVATFVAATGVPLPARAAPGATDRQSTNASSVQPNGDTPASSVTDTSSPALSLDGLSIAYSSDATNLVSGDTNGVADVFVRTLSTRKVVRASVSSSGAQANGASYSPSLSVDGRFVAFVSTATNLVSGDANGVADVFLRDLKTKKTTRVSVASNGDEADGPSTAPFVSLFGRWVTFESAATNLGSNDFNGLADAFIRDTTRKTTVRIAPPAFEQIAPEFNLALWTDNATISYDGRYVAFTRGATGYVPVSNPATTPAGLDTFVLDRVEKKTYHIPVPPYASRLPSGQIFTCRPMSDHPIISADGRYVALEAWSACEFRHALVRNPVDPKDILLWDLWAPKTVGYASSNSWGQAGDGDSYDPRISANGHVVAFTSDATNLVAGDTNNQSDIFVHDYGARTTSRASQAADGSQPDGPSWRPSISYEGKNVAFATRATNLAGSDTNGKIDVYRRDRQNQTQNRAPVLRAPVSGKRRVNALDTVRIGLRATDADRDPLRFGVILGMPDGATIDPKTGVFDWTVRPPVNPDTQHLDVAHQQSCVWCETEVNVVFWVDDPRGNSDVKLATFVIQDVKQTVRCKGLQQCDA